MKIVLILIVVDNGLVPTKSARGKIWAELS